LHVSTVESTHQTLEFTRKAFLDENLGSAWERVSALVVNPGIEFGDDFVLPYKPSAAAALSKFIEREAMVYEAHSTDYQTQDALRKMVDDHFAILKVGPALTHAFREAILWLAMIEEEQIPVNDRSNIVAVLETVMREHPEHWRDYYRGNEVQLAHKRFSSLSDRIRYYWSEPRVQQALGLLLANLTHRDITSALMQIRGTEAVASGLPQGTSVTPEWIIITNIRCILDAYDQAVGECLSGG
jgi:D-tagatose-1,6-bisphosphate aldolase subunit GatZ/KbaZ